MGQQARKKTHKALVLGGGGPAAGPHIGALKYFEEKGMEFDVWALSCIGAWVGVAYNTFNREDGRTRAQQTEDFFKNHIFREDDSYALFPMNKAFAPDMDGFVTAWCDYATKAWRDYLFDSSKSALNNLTIPTHVVSSVFRSLDFLANARWTNKAERNAWFFNEIMAVNPLSRLIIALLWRSPINGIVKLYDENSPLMKALHFERLSLEDRPDLYHNAWNLDRNRMSIFHNRYEEQNKKDPPRMYKPIEPQTVCACSALPFVEQTVEIDGEIHCEGALIDTVNFKNLLRDYPLLEEVWVSRIVDTSQVKAQVTMVDGLSTLCMLFPAAVGEDDVKLFKQHVRKRKSGKPVVIEIPPSMEINFEWSHKNLENGIRIGYEATKRLDESRRNLHS